VEGGATRCATSTGLESGRELAQFIRSGGSPFAGSRSAVEQALKEVFTGAEIRLPQPVECDGEIAETVLRRVGQNAQRAEHRNA
jgi:hypothetical protein